MDIKYFYLNDFMDRSEYKVSQVSMIPQELIIAYNLKYNIHNGYIIAQRTKKMYGIVHAGKMTQDALVQNLTPYGYNQSRKPLGP